MKKGIFSLLLIVASCFTLSVNAEIKECSNDNYNKVSSLSFEDNKLTELHTISDSIAKIEEGMLIINVATRKDTQMNVNSQYRYDNTTFKSVGGYYTVQGSGMFIVYALSTDGKVYKTVVDYREADENASYKPELKDTGLTNIEHIATPDESLNFYLLEEPVYTPHRVVYAIDKEKNIYTDETMEPDNYCKITNPNPSLSQEESATESTKSEKKQESKLKDSIEIPIYMVAIHAGVFGIVIGLLIASIIKNKKHE